MQLFDVSEVFSVTKIEIVDEYASQDSDCVKGKSGSMLDMLAIVVKTAWTWPAPFDGDTIGGINRVIYTFMYTKNHVCTSPFSIQWIYL